jgi:hypothetical protein
MAVHEPLYLYSKRLIMGVFFICVVISKSMPLYPVPFAALSLNG